MPKYRALTINELESMEKEFIDFLVLNGIPGDDWVKLKTNNPEKADGICDSFSDVVFTKILKSCRYIEKHAKKQVVSIFCDEKKMHLVGIEAPEDMDIDFTDNDTFQKLKSDPPEGLQLIKSEKEYAKERELELWDMLNDGFFVSDQKLYMALFS